MNNANRLPIVLQDYEEPLQNAKMLPSATVNVNVKLFPQTHVNNNTKVASNSAGYGKPSSTNNAFFNNDEEFKKKVFLFLLVILC